ncbi:protein GDAP2 homolog [Teleopsis dalmanni]|uniref:protein GDAP2 homolog n=1 Tax=Teleopsis dalmanni TaxID=139649 RepID=UPI0018CE2820|nr:protein GDAP2 homolog [Teleopsis dalmanni]
MTMVEGMTSIDLGSSPMQETTDDIANAMQTEPVETAEERNVLCKAKELNLRTIALCNIVTSQQSFPADLAAHIALRTIRRYLEKFTTQIVILCVGSNERGIYEVLAPLYFPRDHLEERSALWQLPKDIGGEFGEPQHPDRQIRIIRNPQHRVLMRHTDDDSDTSPHDMEGNSSDLEYGLDNLNGLQQNRRNQTYSQMQSDLDRQHLLGDRPRNGVFENVVADGIEGLEHQERYVILNHNLNRLYFI